MILYKIFKNGIQTNGWDNSNGLDETHHEPGFGLLERWKLESECSPEELASSLESRPVEENSEVLEHRLPKTYEVVIEDIGNQRDVQRLREQRNARLADCDHTQLSDSPLSSEEKADYAAYRQALRDLPENTSDPLNPEWPVKPE